MQQLALFPLHRGNTRGVCPGVEEQLPITYDDLAKRHGVTTRSIRFWIEEGELDPPEFVRVPGSRRLVARWPESILAKSDSVAARRRSR